MNPQDIILVLTDRPDLYGPFIEDMNKKGVYFPTVGLLTRELLSSPDCSGIILDVKLVMASDASSRDKLFSLCQQLPMVRAKIDLGTKKPVFIDPLETLKQSDQQTPRRAQQRTKVRLEANWSHDTDPAMTETNEGVVLDISPGGAFLHAPNMLPREDYLHLRILEIANKRPIQCAVRWRQPTPRPGRLTGVGLRFLDIAANQLDEIKNILSKKQKD